MAPKCFASELIRSECKKKKKNMKNNGKKKQTAYF